MQYESLQSRTENALSELGEKIFLDRYAIKDAKKETLSVGLLLAPTLFTASAQNS